MVQSDTRNKEVALRRIKRLGSSGLALEPFVRSIFDLVNDAVPHSPHRVLLARSNSVEAFIGITAEAYAVVAHHRRYYVGSAPEQSGSRFRLDTPTLQTLGRKQIIWTRDEIAFPNF